MKRLKKLLKDNKGFSLIEMVIVIAITLILTAAAYITIGVINNGRAKDAALTFNSEISSTIAKSKGQICVANGVEEPDYKFCIKLYRTAGKVYMQKGFYTGSGDISEANYVTYDEDNENSGKGISLTSRVKVEFTDINGNTVEIDENNPQYIVFAKDGTCLSGYGYYNFKKKSGASVVGITIRKNGSRQME